MNEQLQINACTEVIGMQAARIRELEERIRWVLTANSEELDQWRNGDEAARLVNAECYRHSAYRETEQRCGRKT